MFLRIETIPSRKLIGCSLQMSFAQNRTFELWKSFMPRRKEIQSVNNELISMQVYPDGFDFIKFNPEIFFDKWAAVEVNHWDQIPEDMQQFALPGGLYAVFLHKGKASEGDRTFGFIFGTWLPESDYVADNRPHFEILGEKYKNDSPDSQEEIWIPIKHKSI